MGKKKACRNCSLVEADDELALILITGKCPECGKDWSHKQGGDASDDGPEDDAEDPRHATIEDLSAMLAAYATSVSVGSAATWLQAREVVAAARRLQEAEEALAPCGADGPVMPGEVPRGDATPE